MAAAPVMNPSLSPHPQLQKMIQDVIDCIHEMKNEFIENQLPITDDSPTLQRFCGKLEYLLQAEQKVKTTFLGAKKDYWHYFCDCLQNTKGLNDGIKYVKSINDVKTTVGRGRAFIRFALMHQRLADTLQACVMNGRLTSEWYTPRSVWLEHRSSSAIIHALYDINDVQFDLAPTGYDLDASWPTFARKSFGNPYAWNSPSRSSSFSSLSGLGQDIPTLKLDTSNMSETSSLREEPYESFHEGELYEKIEHLETQIAQLHENEATWKDKEKQWEENLHRLKKLNHEQELRVQSLMEDVTHKTNLLDEKQAAIGHLESRMANQEQHNTQLLQKVEELIAEKSEGATANMDNANKMQGFLENLNTSQQKNNELLLENTELKGRIQTVEEELGKCRNDFETRQEALESELNKISASKLEVEGELETLREKEKLWVERELELSNQEGEGKELEKLVEQLRLDAQEYESRLQRKNVLIEKHDQTVCDLKYEISDLTKRLENMETVKEDKEAELGRSLQASQALNHEIKAEIEQLKSELQDRDGSVEREVTTYSEKIRVLEEEKEQLQARVECGDKERAEKQNLEMKMSDLADQVKCLEEERNRLKQALESGEKAEASLQQSIKEYQEHITDCEQKIQTSENLVQEKLRVEENLNSRVKGLEGDVAHLELKLTSSASELDVRNRSSSDLEDTVEMLHLKIEDFETKVASLEREKREQDSEMAELHDSLTACEQRERSLIDEVEGLRSLLMLLDQEDLEISAVKEIPNVSKQMCAKVENILQEKLVLDHKMRHIEVENMELQTQVRVFKQEADDYSNELQHTQLEITELKTLVCQLESHEADMARKLEMKNEIIEEQASEIQKFEARLEENRSTVQVMETEMAKLEAATVETMTQVRELQQENMHKETDIDNLRVDIQEQINQIDKLRLMIQEMDSEISGRDQRISQLDATNKRLDNEMRLLQDLVATANESSVRFEKQIRSFEERITVMTSSFESLQHDNERLLSDKTRLMSENSRLHTQLETVTEERKRLEDEQDMLEKSLITAFEEKLAIAEEKQRVLQEKLEQAPLVRSGDPAVAEDSSAVARQMECSEHKTQLKIALEKLEKCSAQITELKNLIGAMKTECQDHKSRVSEMEGERRDVEAEFEKLNLVIKNMCEENEDLKKVLSDKDNEIVEVSQMVSDLEEEKVKLTQTLVEGHRCREQVDAELLTERNALFTQEGKFKELESRFETLHTKSKTESECLQLKCDELVKKVAHYIAENQQLSQKLESEVQQKNEPFAKCENSGVTDAKSEDLVDSPESSDASDVTVVGETENEPGVSQIEDSELQKSSDVARTSAALIQSLGDEILKLKQQNYDMETAMKCYINQELDVAKMMDRMTDQETLIQTLELELQEIRDEREIEREKQWNDLGIVRDSLLHREDESRLLSEELKRTSMVLDDERNTVVKLKNELSETKKHYESVLSKKEDEIIETVSTSVELKKKLIKLIKEKDSLWKKTDKLEYQQRMKAAETWMNDTEVPHCLGCRTEFSFMLRKHHCRLCGRIYCHNCSNNWVLTTHSKNKSRVCNLCFIERESGSHEGTPGPDSDIEDDASVQVPKLRSETWSSYNSLLDGNIQKDKDMKVDMVTPGSSVATPSQDGDSISSSPPPDIDRILTHNQTDDSKLVHDEPSGEEAPKDFQSTTDDLTSSPLKVEVDGEEVPGDKDDVFHLISDEEVARSLSHSHSEYLASLEKSLTSSVTLSVDAISKSSPKAHDETMIKPGMMFAVPVLIDSPGITLCWEFSTDPKSITFSINYKEAEDTPPDQQQVLFTPCKCNSHRQAVQGELIAQKAGIYTLYFDNASSRYTSKCLKYKLQVKK